MSQESLVVRKLLRGAQLARYAVSAAFQLLTSQTTENTLPRRHLHRLGNRSYIEETVSFRFPERIDVGCGVLLGPYCVIWASEHARLSIGDRVLLGPHVTILTANHGIAGSDVLIADQPQIESDVRIERGAWLGARVVVLPGVTIGEGAVVGAGAVVTHDVRPFEIVGGVPARHIGSRKRPARCVGVLRSSERNEEPEQAFED